jgi:8-oxo-dGTP diphosphatase
MPRPVTPAVAVDVVIELLDLPGRPVVLIERANPPPGWALPGGFVDVGETLEAAACREMEEETGLDVRLTSLLGCYSAPSRDPRGHTIGVVYVGEAHGEPRGGDDAARARAFDPHGALPPLAFDHGDILTDYRRYLEGGTGVGSFPTTRHGAQRRAWRICAGTTPRTRCWRPDAGRCVSALR